MGFSFTGGSALVGAVCVGTAVKVNNGMLALVSVSIAIGMGVDFLPQETKSRPKVIPVINKNWISLFDMVSTERIMNVTKYLLSL